MARKSRKRNRNASRTSVAEPAPIDISAELPESGSPSCDLTGAETPDDAIADLPTEVVKCETVAVNAESDPVIKAIAANTALIQQLLDQVGQKVEGQPATSSNPQDGLIRAGLTDEQLEDEVAELRHRNEELTLELQRRQSRIDELTEQTEDLAAQVAQSGVRQTVATNQSCTGDALSWEDRKQLILQQLESDTFDADEFVASIAEEINAEDEQSPQELLDELVSRLQRSESELAERKIEIGELRMLLEQQSETREGGVAIGAAAIAQMVDGDELVMQERERLQTLQDQWEEKFRQSEIEASLERAKLSRERQELARKTDQLEEELEHLRREAKQGFDPAESGTSRRWLAKLGLSDAD